MQSFSLTSKELPWQRLRPEATAREDIPALLYGTRNQRSLPEPAHHLAGLPEPQLSSQQQGGQANPWR